MIPRVELGSKLTGERVLADFPFTLDEGVTILSATVAASVYSGIDATPNLILTGAPGISGANVTQTVVNGTEGVIYQLLCTATLSDGQRLQLAGYLAVVPALL